MKKKGKIYIEVNFIVLNHIIVCFLQINYQIDSFYKNEKRKTKIILKSINTFNF